MKKSLTIGEFLTNIVPLVRDKNLTIVFKPDMFLSIQNTLY